jgi:hypothetical protein
MGLIVDCNNLLHTSMPPALAGLDELRLCRLIGAGKPRGRAVVVCDGGPRDDQSAVNSVELMYAGPGRTADDVIIDLINADTAPRRLTVVSNDNQIRKAAKRLRAKALGCEQFISQLLSWLSARRPGEATADDKPAAGPLDDDQVRKWLETFGVEHDGDDEHLT